MIERKSSDFYTEAIRKLREEEGKLADKLRRLENAKMPKRKEERLQYVNDILDTRHKLGEIRDQKVIYLFELENLKDDREDFEGTEYCECIGYCYRKNIYISDEGEILYLDTDENGADKIGEPAFEPNALKPLDTLPEAEKDMILNYLNESEETPLWFKNKND